MKQVTYEFDWTNILPAVVNYNLIEDGYWRVELIMESMTGLISPQVEGQVQATLPGMQHRIVGFKLVNSDGYGSMTFRVLGGQVIYASDTDQRGPEESGGSVGADSGPPPASFTAPTNAGF